MIPFFPMFYKDELIYSVISRYHHYSGNISITQTTKDLFGKKKYIIPDLTTDLELLFINVRHFTVGSINEWISNHTLYNYYTNFNTDAVKAVIKEYMIKGNGENKLHYLTGQVASTVKEPKYFKYCPKCWKEDTDKYGESYWRTYHQLPSVFVCLEHMSFLEESTEYFRQMDPQFAYTHNVGSLKEKKNVEKFAKVNPHFLTSIARESYRITTKNYNFRQDNLSAIYRSILRDNGFIKVNGNINQVKLREDFIKFYGSEFLKLMQSLPSGVDGECWLRAITRKQRKSFHPVRHLLLIHFLGESVDTIYHHHNTSYNPFGIGPYLCLNAAAGHYLKPVITDLEVTTCKDTKKPVGTFHCQCGFVYSRRGPDVTTEDKLKIGRIKEFGDTWVEKLHHLINQEKLSYRACARILKVDAKTVIKYAKSKEKTEIVVNNEKDEIKNLWLELRSKYPESSRTQLRKINSSLYMRLYRYDKEWLLENSPEKVKQNNDLKRVNWHERDLQILELVKLAVNELRSSKKPIRLTLSKIGMTIRHLSLLEKKLHKLPLTKEYIDDVCESIEEFQKRRIKCSIEQLDLEDLSLWRIRREAGIKESFYSKLDHEINLNIEAKLSISVGLSEL
ncbi:TnsD family transposase [Solibacillus silvestris]